MFPQAKQRLQFPFAEKTSGFRCPISLFTRVQSVLDQKLKLKVCFESHRSLLAVFNYV